MRAVWNRRMQRLGVLVVVVGAVALGMYWKAVGLDDPSHSRLGASTIPSLLSLFLLGLPLLAFARHDHSSYDLPIGSGYIPRSRLIDAAVVGVYVGGIVLWGQFVLRPALASRAMMWRGAPEPDLELFFWADTVLIAYYALAGLILLIFFVAKLFTPVEIPSPSRASRSRSR